MFRMLNYLDDFLLYLQTNNYSPETIFNYERDLKTLESFLASHELKFNKLTRKDIENYKAHLKSIDRVTLGEVALKGETRTKLYKGSKTHETLSTRSVNRMLSSFRSYLKYLIKNGVEVPLSRDEVELVRSERKKSRVAELNDLVMLIECPHQFEKREMVALRNRAILELLFSTGMRISELIKLNREQINKSGKIFIEGKGKKERFVYLTPRALANLARYLNKRTDGSPALFIPFGGAQKNEPRKRLSKSYVQKTIKKYVRLLGIDVPTSAHSLRHGYGTYLAEQGASPVAIQILLGHESPATTDRYIHASDKFAEKQHKEYHPLSGK